MPRVQWCVWHGRKKEGLSKPGSLTGSAFCFHFPSPRLYLQHDLVKAPLTPRPFCGYRKCHRVTVYIKMLGFGGHCGDACFQPLLMQYSQTEAKNVNAGSGGTTATPWIKNSGWLLKDMGGQLSVHPIHCGLVTVFSSRVPAPGLGAWWVLFTAGSW